MKLIKRVLGISYKKGLSHIGSCITILPILQEIFDQINPRDIVLIDNGHAGLGLYVVLEEYYTGINAEELFEKHGVHPNRDIGNHIFSSAGSLGHNMGIGIGMALVDRTRDVYVVVSDGSMMEGSNWEALRIKADLKLDNLKIYANFNGFTATREINIDRLGSQMKSFDPSVQIRLTHNSHIKCLSGVNAHYKVLTEEEYQEALKDVDAYELADSIPGV